MKPRSSSATGSSFLSRIATTMSGVIAIAPLRRCLRLFVDRQAFGEPARHAMIGRRQNEDVAHLVPQRAGPVKSPGLRPDGLSIATTSPNVTPKRAQSRHAQRAHGEVFMIRIDFHLHRPRQLHLVFLLVGGDGALQLRPQNRDAADRLPSCCSLRIVVSSLNVTKFL